jgi:hypothetical protein
MRRFAWLVTPVLALIAYGAGAATIPAVTVSLQVNSGTPWVASPTGATTTDPNQFTYQGTEVKTGWTLTWDMAVNTDPVVTSNITVLNNTANIQTYTFIVTLPISAITPSTLIGGSVSGSVTDSNGGGATLGTAVGSALYTAKIDGAAVATLYPDPSGVSAGSFLSAPLAGAAFGTPIPSAAGPAALTDIAIQIKFTLTPGDQAGFTSVFVVEPVPEPTTLGLVSLGLAGLALIGRRRSA